MKKDNNIKQYNHFAIITSYVPATNNRGARIKATAEYGEEDFKVIVPFGYNDEDVIECYERAAEACINKVLEYAKSSDSTLSLPIIASARVRSGYIFFASYEHNAQGEI